MNDIFLILVVPLTIIILATIYKMFDIWLEYKDTCQHTWSRWSDPQKGDAHPYQTRNCNKCNMHQQRLVQ
jgi:hypothetical protein